MNTNISTVSLKKLFHILYHNILPIILCAVVFSLAVYVYNENFVDKKYCATVSIIVDNRSTMDTTEEQTSQKKTNTDITASRMMVDSYIAILRNTSVLTSIADNVNQSNESIKNGTVSPLTAASVGEMLSMSGINDTEILQVKATSLDPQISVDVCKALVEEAKTVLERTMNTLTVNSVEGDNILYPSKPQDTGATTKSILAGIFGFALAYGIAVIISILDNTIRATDDIAQICGYPVIGEVPSMNTDSQKKKKNKLQIRR